MSIFLKKVLFMENKIVCEVPRYHGIHELGALMSDLVLER